jgi:hypothetical protein
VTSAAFTLEEKVAVVDVIGDREDLVGPLLLLVSEPVPG